MAIVNGTSVVNGQNASGFVTLTRNDFDLWISNANVLPPKRIGYYWVLARRIAAPNEIFVVSEGYLRSPGVYMDFATEYGFTVYQFAVYAQWNRAGIPFRITYL